MRDDSISHHAGYLFLLFFRGLYAFIALYSALEFQFERFVSTMVVLGVLTGATEAVFRVAIYGLMRSEIAAQKAEERRKKEEAAKKRREEMLAAQRESSAKYLDVDDFYAGARPKK